MTPLEMIAEWRKGCSNAPTDKPELCPECTRALIEALEAKLGAWQQPCNFGGLPPNAELGLPDPMAYAKFSDYVAAKCRWRSSQERTDE